MPGLSQSDVEAAANWVYVDNISARSRSFIEITPVFAAAPTNNVTYVDYSAGFAPGVSGIVAAAEVVSSEGEDSIFTTIWVYRQWVNPDTGIVEDSPLSLAGSSPDPSTPGDIGTYSLRDILFHESLHALGVGHLLGSNSGLMEPTIGIGPSQRTLSQLEGQALDYLYPDWVASPVPQDALCPSIAP